LPIRGPDPPWTRSEALRGRTDEATLAYEAAIARRENATQRDFLQRSREALTRA